MYKSDFISTSEFAEIVGVSKHTLFYYDKLGIFSPNLKNENGFRYYSFCQIEPFFVIKSLQEVGMSLSEIKDYLDKRTPEKFVDILKEHDKKLADEVKKLKKIRQLVLEKRRSIVSFLKSEDSDVELLHMEKECLFLTVATADTHKNNAEISFATHIKKATEKGLYLPYSVGQTTNLCDIIKGDYINYKYFYSKVNKKLPNLFIKPEGIYAVYYHKKGYHTIAEAYEKILEFAQNNNLLLDGMFFEDVVLDELAVNGYDNFVVKICVLIKSE